MSFRVKWSVYAGISSMMDRTRCDDDDGNRNGAQCVCVCASVFRANANEARWRENQWSSVRRKIAQTTITCAIHTLNCVCVKCNWCVASKHTQTHTHSIEFSTQVNLDVLVCWRKYLAKRRWGRFNRFHCPNPHYECFMSCTRRDACAVWVGRCLESAKVMDGLVHTRTHKRIAPHFTDTADVLAANKIRRSTQFMDHSAWIGLLPLENVFPGSVILFFRECRSPNNVKTRQSSLKLTLLLLSLHFPFPHPFRFGACSQRVCGAMACHLIRIPITNRFQITRLRQKRCSHFKTHQIYHKNHKIIR